MNENSHKKIIILLALTGESPVLISCDRETDRIKRLLSEEQPFWEIPPDYSILPCYILVENVYHLM